MPRVSNFNAGPAALPLPVLERAREELLDFQGTGMSIMEHSHRGKAYDAVHNRAVSLLRELLSIPDEYHVLFLQGGASQQFAMVPLNLLGDKSADYIITGQWSEKALSEAKIVGRTRVAATTKQENGTFPRIPKQEELSLDENAAYVHITTNNTIAGTQWHYIPEVGNVPLVADMSSDFLWKKFDVTRYGLIYAGAQKNLGPSGVVAVIIRKDLAEREPKNIPKIFRYKTFADQNSLYNTPPTFAIYLVQLVLEWVKESGGLSQMEARNREKGALLYGTIDAMPDFYRSPVEKESRSFMNVVFRLPSEALEERFIKEATAAGLVGLKGHRSVGGIRASIYNAASVEDVKKLCDFMKDFAEKNRG